MLKCAKCGSENPLGLVFCSACGSKLDLRNMRLEQVERMAAPKQRVSVSRRLMQLVVLLVALSAVAAAWPRGERIGKEGSEADGKRLVDRLSVVGRLRPGQSLGITLREPEINGYLQHFKREPLALQSFSVRLTPDLLEGRIVRSLGAFRVGEREFESRISMDFSCAPAPDGLVVTRCALGHLPLCGPLRAAAMNRVFSSMSSQAEWRTWRDVVGKVNVQDGQLTLTVKK
jgi:hypothetical protein